MSLRLNTKYVMPFLPDGALENIAGEVKSANDALYAGTGKGSDFLGWLTLPQNYDKDEFARIKSAAKKILQDTKIVTKRRCASIFYVFFTHSSCLVGKKMLYLQEDNIQYII